MNKSVGKIAGVASVVAALAGATMLPGASQAWAQSKGPDARQQIVGVWKLVSSTNTAKDGKVTSGTSFGPTPLGQAIFTASGHYASVLLNPNIPKFASGSRMTGTPEENKAVVQGSIASFGTYAVSADGKALTLKQGGGTWAARTGTEEKRTLVVAGDDMKYITPSSIGGSSELAFKRVK